MRRGLLLVLAALGGAVSGAAAAPVAPAPRIVNGTPSGDLPAVGALLRGSDPAAAITWCSGTLVGCRTFLTAAHCVCDGDGVDCQPGGPLAPSPGSYSVFLQHAGFAAVESISVHPDFAFPVGDVALVRLAAPVVGIAPTAVETTAAPAAGTAGVIAGFGRTGGATSDYGVKRIGDVVTAVCTDVANETSVCWDFTAPIGPAGTDSNTCNGDSGGPLLVAAGGAWHVAGVTSGGASASCQPPDHSYDANVFRYHDWIAQHAGGDLGTDACGELAPVEGSGTTTASLDGTVTAAAPDATATFSVPAGSGQLLVTMNAEETGGADFDLYLKRGAPASTADYDCRADGPGQYAACAATTPLSGDWHALVHRVAGAGRWQLTGTVFGLRGACATLGPGAACDDGNPCTEDDVCTPTGCAGAPLPDGTACDDGEVCTPVDTCQAGTCLGSTTPRADCTQSLSATGSSLVLHRGTPSARDVLTWKWSRGSVATDAFGDPPAGDPLALCLYDTHGGVSSVAIAQPIAGGAPWRTIAGGWRLTDRTGANGGIASLVLRTGPGGRSAVTLKARGERVPLPALPLGMDPDVTVQLIGANACVAARFPSVTINDALRFQAHSR